MTKQITIVDAETQFAARKEKILKLQEQCSKLVITNDVTKGIAVQQLSLLNAEMKLIVTDHKVIKAPVLELYNAIDKLKNDLYNPAEAVYKSGTSKVLAYDQKVRQEAFEKEQRIIKIKTAISAYSNRAIKEMDACMTMEQLRECRTRLIVNADSTVYHEFAPDFEATKATLNEYAKSSRTRIETPAQLDPDEGDAIKEAVEENNLSIGVVEIKEVKVEKMKGTRSTWKHSLVDINHVPLEWLMLDDAKIKAFIKDNKDTLVDGDEFDGVKFFIEESLSIR